VVHCCIVSCTNQPLICNQTTHLSLLMRGSSNWPAITVVLVPLLGVQPRYGREEEGICCHQCQGGSCKLGTSASSMSACCMQPESSSRWSGTFACMLATSASVSHLCRKRRQRKLRRSRLWSLAWCVKHYICVPFAAGCQQPGTSCEQRLQQQSTVSADHMWLICRTALIRHIQGHQDAMSVRLITS
jgi:hypothetical protein